MEPRPLHLNRKLTRYILIAAAIGLSGFSSAFIIYGLTRFDQTAGAADPAPSHWPVSSALRRSGARPDLLVFVHPFCSCTAATFNELARVPAKRNGRGISPALHIVTEGSLKDEESRRADLWNKTRSFEDATISWDEGGREAKLFGARTSGDTMLYSARGDLLFRGGITGSRGHEGDNNGLDQLVAALDAGPGAPPLHAARSFVFGCALLSSAGQERAGREEKQ